MHTYIIHTRNTGEHTVLCDLLEEVRRMLVTIYTGESGIVSSSRGSPPYIFIIRIIRSVCVQTGDLFIAGVFSVVLWKYSKKKKAKKKEDAWLELRINIDRGVWGCCRRNGRNKRPFYTNRKNWVYTAW